MPLLFNMETHHRLRACLWCSLALLLAACKTTPADPAAPGAATGTPQTQDKADVGFLLSMTYDEAKKLSKQNLVVSPFYKIAADEITVLKQDASGQPLRARAKGHVFLQIDFREQLQALGQEAYIESGGEIIMRGKPLLKRGRSVVEGLSDYTVFYIRGLRLQVIGSHRLAKQEDPGGSPVEGPQGTTRLPSWNVTPNWQRSWKDGPNPILPALSPEDIPQSMRATPLLPMPEGPDTPRMLPEGEASPPPLSEEPASNAPAMKVPELDALSPAHPKEKDAKPARPAEEKKEPEKEEPPKPS